jgi:hypothetical protein
MASASRVLDGALFDRLEHPLMAGTWSRLANLPPFAASTMLLLSDGTVMCQASNSVNWSRLRPDASGDYSSGTWSALAAMRNARLYYASAVLADGRVFVAGGEYNGGTTEVELNAAEIYDPLANTWADLPVPSGWTAIDDAPSCVLPDGRLLLGSIGTTATALFDPTTNAWTAGPSKDDVSSEETWTLLPDQTVLTAECTNHPRAEKYVVALNQWVSAGSTPSDLVEASSIEIGPALLLPDGRVFALGATGATSLYTMPASPGQPGTWASGPVFPLQAGQQLIAKDAPACLLPNGRVLCTASPAAGCAASFEGYCPPTFFFEFDPATALLNPITPPENSGEPAYQGRMLLLPTGQVLFVNESTDVWIYTPDGAPQDSWRPRITSCPGHLTAAQQFMLQGCQLNGLSHALSYGDDAQMATNYPIVRIRNLASNHVVYCRTSGHSTMGVATGGTVHSTNVAVPAAIEAGPSELVVVANGIASSAFPAIVGPAP